MTDQIAQNRQRIGLRATLAILIMTTGINARAAESEPLRAGMIGLDTSHVPAFAKLFNSAKPTYDRLIRYPESERGRAR